MLNLSKKILFTAEQTFWGALIFVKNINFGSGHLFDQQTMFINWCELFLVV